MAFAVFGMTRPAANKLAKKRVDKAIERSGQPVGESAYMVMVGTEESSIMRSSETAMLGGPYDAPQFAQEYLKLARNQEGRTLSIKAHVAIKEKTKTGRTRKKWLNWPLSETDMRRFGVRP